MNKEFFELWDNLYDAGIATQDELQLVTAINGDTVETLNDILYARTGMRDWEQWEENYINE